MAPKPNLLLVDDDPMVLATLRAIFENQGYRVLAAESAKQAIGILRNGALPDAVIADLNMEKPDIGLKVAEVAGRLRPRPAVIIFTGYANAGNSRKAFEMHVDYLATKPVDPALLSAAVERLLRRRSQALGEEEGTW